VETANLAVNEQGAALMTKSHVLRSLEAGAVLLFFLQSLRVIFSVLFGIIYDRLFVGPLDWWMPGG